MQHAHVEVARLIEARDFESARRVSEAAVTADPNAAAPHLWLAQIALSDGRLADARVHLDAAIGNGAPEARVARLELALARREGRPRLPWLERLVALEPHEPRWLREVFDLQFAARRNGLALAALNRLLDLAPDPAAMQSLVALVDRIPGECVETCARLVAAAPDDWSLRTVLATALALAGRMDEAWDEVATLVDLAPGRSFPPRLHVAIGTRLQEDAHRARLERVFEAHPRSAGLLWSLVTFLDTRGETARARALVREHWDWARHTTPPQDLVIWEYVDAATAGALDDPGSPLHFQVLLFNNRIEEAIAFAPRRQVAPLLRQALALARSGVVAMPPLRDPGEVTVSGQDRPNGTVLVFAGIRDQAWLPAHLLDLFFAKRGLRAIYLRDYSRLAFLRGLASIGPSLDATIAHLRSLAGERRGPLYTLGMSAGGVGAVAYAEALGARASLVFSPQTTFAADEAARIGDARARAWARRLRESVDVHGFDMRDILPRMPAGYRVTAYAGAANPEDTAHVQRIAALPNVRVELIEGEAEHSTLGPATARVPFLRILAEAFRARG